MLLLTPLNGYAIPLTPALSILLALYGRSIRRAATGVEPWPMTMRVIVAVLLALAVFWSTERVARTMGEAPCTASPGRSSDFDGMQAQ